MFYKIGIYKDPWMDNSIENFYVILKGIEKETNSCEVELTSDLLKMKINNREKFIKELTGKIINEKRPNLVVMEKDKKTNIRKEVKKDHLLLQEEKKINGKVAFKEDIYKTEDTYKIISNIFDLSDGKNICVLCGRKFNRAIKKLQQANYPFATKIRSLSGTRSYKDEKTLSLKEYFDNLCSLCYLIGILLWTDEAIIYRTFPGERSFLFLPVFENLKELHDFKKYCRYSGILGKNGRYSNIKVNINSEDLEVTPGKFSTLLCFYEKFVNDSLGEVVSSNWSIMQIPFSLVKNVKMDSINVNDGIIGVIKKIKEDDESLERIYSDLIKKLYFFSENKKNVDWDLTKELQEKLSESFLKDNFRVFAKCLLPKGGRYIVFSSKVMQNLEKLIFIWRWIGMGVPKESIDIIRSVGNIIAKVSQNNVSLLYKIDKVRRLDEFWNVLREVARKIPGMEEEDLIRIKPTALDDLIQLIKDIIVKNKDIWKEVRDLLVVYSSMFLAINKMHKGGNNK